jgi:hypothetical protein
MEKHIMDEKFAQELIRYGMIMVDNEYFTSDGKSVMVRIIHWWNRKIAKHEFYYYEMINGEFSKLIDISDTALGKYKIGQKNGGHRYPTFDEIIRIIGGE